MAYLHSKSAPARKPLEHLLFSCLRAVPADRRHRRGGGLHHRGPRGLLVGQLLRAERREQPAVRLDHFVRQLLAHSGPVLHVRLQRWYDVLHNFFTIR